LFEVKRYAFFKIISFSNWTDIPLNPKILSNFEHAGYIHPRKIQSYSIPLILNGYDLKAQAETGSGESLECDFSLFSI
jgi:superfamily II DNA/RNA helicase